MEEIDTILNRIYGDLHSPGSLASTTKLWREAKKIIPNITLERVREYLKSQDSSTLHGTIPKSYLKRPVYVHSPGYLLSGDLADFKNLSEFNQDYKYLFVLIDCFSRKLWVVPLKDKRGKTVADVLHDFFKSSRYKYTHLWVDRGKEFFSKAGLQVCAKFNVNMYSTLTRLKAVFAERVIRTLKQKLYRALTHFNTKNYIQYLEPIVSSYNNSPHRGLLGQTPNSVHDMTDRVKISTLARKMYGQKFENYGKNIYKREVIREGTITSDAAPLEKGTFVRLLSDITDSPFTKSFNQIFTYEIFQIDKVLFDTPITYTLQDLSGNRVKGLVYRSELKPVTKPIYFPIEKILATRKIRGTKQFLVKYVGYPEHFNEWRYEQDIKDLD